MAQDAVAISIPNNAVIPGPKELSDQSLRSPKWYKSNAVLYTDTTSVQLFEIPGACIVTDAAVRVTTAFEASGSSAAATATLTVPNDTGTETILDTSTGGLQATGFWFATGKAVTPASGGYIILAYTPGTTTAGALEVYVELVQLQDRL